MEATTQLKCLVLARERFVDILGPLYSLMQREKSPAVVTQRLMRLQTKVEHPPPAVGRAQLPTNKTEAAQRAAQALSINNLPSSCHAAAEQGFDEDL